MVTFAHEANFTKAKYLAAKQAYHQLISNNYRISRMQEGLKNENYIDTLKKIL
jgi:hypothetical protein